MRYLLLSLILLCHSQFTSAADRMGQARLFLGSTQVSPSEVNTEMNAQGLKEVDLNNQFGVEITFPFLSHLNWGLRYSKRVIGQDETANASATDYQLDMTQDVMDFVARVAILKTDLVMFDAVAGVGGSNTKYKIKTASQDGELEKKGSPFATPNAFAGVSFGVGTSKFKLVVESGYEMNKVDSFKSSGNINGNVTKADLSGAYINLGLMFDGIPVFNK